MILGIQLSDNLVMESVKGAARFLSEIGVSSPFTYPVGLKLVHMLSPCLVSRKVII